LSWIDVSSIRPSMPRFKNLNVTTNDGIIFFHHLYLFFLSYKWMKAHYGGQKLLSQILLFETMCFWTFTKLILEGFLQMVLEIIYFKNHLNNYHTWWSIPSYITYEFIIPFQFYMNGYTHVILRIASRWGFSFKQSINARIHKNLLKKHYHLKGKILFVGGFVSKLHFMYFSKH
jgi:hypothetical protein